MKPLLRISFLAILLTGLAISGCKKNKNETKITGTAAFPTGVSADLSGAVAGLYLSQGDWAVHNPALTTLVDGSGPSVTFTFNNLNAGTYFLDVWKDVDGNNVWSTGDYVGWYGSGSFFGPVLDSINLASDQTFTASVTMYVMIPGAN
jgi:uncharacterized protein (DUF2141 family)